MEIEEKIAGEKCGVVDLSSASERGRYLAHPGLFESMCRSLPDKPRGRLVLKGA